MIQNNDSTSGYRCTYCGAEDSGSIEVTCDVCGAEWPEEEMSSWLGEGLTFVLTVEILATNHD